MDIYTHAYRYMHIHGNMYTENAFAEQHSRFIPVSWYGMRRPRLHVSVANRHAVALPESHACGQRRMRIRVRTRSGYDVVRTFIVHVRLHWNV